MSLYDDLLKPWTYEDHLAECAEDGEEPMTREDWAELMARPIEGKLGQYRGFVFIEDE